MVAELRSHKSCVTKPASQLNSDAAKKNNSWINRNSIKHFDFGMLKPMLMVKILELLCINMGQPLYEFGAGH